MGYDGMENEMFCGVYVVREAIQCVCAQPRNSDHLNIPKCGKVAAQRGFFYRATKAWNRSLQRNKNCANAKSFKKHAKAELRLTHKINVKENFWLYVGQPRAHFVVVRRKLRSSHAK